MRRLPLNPDDTSQDATYSHANALYYQTRRNRLSGCNKETLRRIVGQTRDVFDASMRALLSRGWTMENGNDVMLTADGWQAVLNVRQNKSHAVVRFTATEEQPAGVGSCAYRFVYLFRDEIGRQHTRSVTVSITDELCRRWQMLEPGDLTNVQNLLRLLRRLAFDHLITRLADRTLNEHENFHVGGLLNALPCRYHPDDLPLTEQEEYEVEWQEERRS